jgi:hypothetical protein
MKAADYCLPIYLNQSAVFDMLAIMEDGLAHVSTIKTAETTKNKGEAGVGATNVFALLGITLKAERAGEANRETTQERVHTPVSLFAKVRSTLHAQKLVHDLTTSTVSLEELKPGDFVEFEVTLRRNPLAEVLEAIVETIGAISVMTSWNQTKPAPTTGKGKGKQDTDQLKPIVDQSKRMLAALKTGGSVDLVGPIAGRLGNVIISVETRYFAENWAEEIGNGRFRVLGKIIQNTSGTDERISLLRNTQFAHMTAAMEPMRAAVATANESGLTLPEVVIDVGPPTIRVLPISIFL